MKYSPDWYDLVYFSFIFLFAVVFASFVYWREESVRESIKYLSVVLWQLMIWIPWVGLMAFKKQYTFVHNRSKSVQVFRLVVLSFVLIALHFAWFFYISRNFSPYLGAPATKYGVYPYFFIFWTIIDFIFLGGFVAYLNLKEERRKRDRKEHIKIQVRKGNREFILNPDEIMWIASSGYYAELHTAQGRFLLRKPLKDLIRILPKHDFMRIHRSTIININAVSKLERLENNGKVILQDGTTRNISKSRIKLLKEALKTFGQSHS